MADKIEYILASCVCGEIVQFVGACISLSWSCSQDLTRAYTCRQLWAVLGWWWRLLKAALLGLLNASSSWLCGAAAVLLIANMILRPGDDASQAMIRPRGDVPQATGASIPTLERPAVCRAPAISRALDVLDTIDDQLHAIGIYEPSIDKAREEFHTQTISLWGLRQALLQSYWDVDTTLSRHTNAGRDGDKESRERDFLVYQLLEVSQRSEECRARLLTLTAADGEEDVFLRRIAEAVKTVRMEERRRRQEGEKKATAKDVDVDMDTGFAARLHDESIGTALDYLNSARRNVDALHRAYEHDFCLTDVVRAIEGICDDHNDDGHGLCIPGTGGVA